MVKVLFVCLGNICRSPMAEAIFQDLLEGHELEGSFSCDSAGTGAYHIGSEPDPRTLETLLKNGIETTQRARQLQKKDFEEFDYILVMDRQNLLNAQKLQKSVNKSKAHLTLVLNYAPELDTKEVPDPYYGGDEGFDLVYDLLFTSLNNFLSQLKRDKDLV